VPDDNGNGLRYPTRSRLSTGTAQGQHIPPMVAQARMLMPNDTLGQELEAMTGLDNGGLGDDGSVNGHNWSSVNSHNHCVEILLKLEQASNFDQADQSATSNSQSSQPLPLSFSGIFSFPSSPPSQANTSFQPELHQQNVDIGSQFEVQDFDHLRPSSAQSYNTSNSEFSLSSTDIDNDSVMSDSNPQLQARNDHLGVDLAHLNMGAGNSAQDQSFWNHQPQNGNDVQSSNGRTVVPDATWTEPRTVAPDSVSPRDGIRLTGPKRGQSENPKIERESPQTLPLCQRLTR
jgi:hypothetical protein